MSQSENLLDLLIIYSDLLMSSLLIGKVLTREQLKICWRHDPKNNKLYIRSVLGAYFFAVPTNWEIKKWSPALRKLAEVLIFQQFWEPKDLRKFLDANWTPWLPKKTKEKNKIEIAAEDSNKSEKTDETTATIIDEQISEKDQLKDQLKDQQKESKDKTKSPKEKHDKDQIQVETGTGTGAGTGIGIGIGIGNGNIDNESDKESTDKTKSHDVNYINWNLRREKNISAISFSGGLDSCAIVPLLDPGFFMAYLKRVIPQPTMLRHKQQLIALDHIHKNFDCSSFVMESDIEMLSMKSVGRVGFPSEYACCLPCVILADHIGITAIATGTIGLFLKGTKFHHFQKTGYFKFWKSLFAKAGIDLFWPVGGVVDRGTAIICEKTKIPGQSCVRNDNGFCNNCFKCFRKNTLILGRLPSTRLSNSSTASLQSGNRIPTGNLKIMSKSLNRNFSNTKIKIPPDAKLKLAKKPLTLIELYQMGILKDRHLEPFKNLDLSYQSRYMKECYDYMVPERLKKQICRRLDRLLGPMTDKQINVVKTLNLNALNKVKIDLEGGY